MSDPTYHVNTGIIVQGETLKLSFIHLTKEFNIIKKIFAYLLDSLTTVFRTRDHLPTVRFSEFKEFQYLH